MVAVHVLVRLADGLVASALGADLWGTKGNGHGRRVGRPLVPGDENEKQAADPLNNHAREEDIPTLT